MQTRSIGRIAAVLGLLLAYPATAYTLTGSLAAGGSDFIRPLTFVRDGTVSVDIRFTSSGSFAVQSDSALYYLNLSYYDFFDPQTGEAQGGDDNLGADEPFQNFGDDSLDVTAPFTFNFHIDYPNAQVRRDYVSQNPGDPFPYETGYTETLLSIRAAVFGNDSPIDYTIRVGGSAVVPEPASWALLIAGFSATGAMMRRRRAIAA